MPTHSNPLPRKSQPNPNQLRLSKTCDRHFPSLSNPSPKARAPLCNMKRTRCALSSTACCTCTSLPPPNAHPHVACILHPASHRACAYPSTWSSQRPPTVYVPPDGVERMAGAAVTRVVGRLLAVRPRCQRLRACVMTTWKARNVAYLCCAV